MSWSWFMTKHTLFSLGWDEWASIVAIMTAVVILVRWLTTKVKTDLLGETNSQLRILNHNMEIYNKHSEKQDERLHRGDVRFAKQDERLNDHEKRITRLENYK